MFWGGESKNQLLELYFSYFIKTTKQYSQDFLNELLTEEQGNITDLTYLKNEHLGTSELDRKAIFDLYCENEKGEKFIVDFNGYIIDIPDIYNRGATTIQILQLDRGTLLNERLKILNDNKNDLNLLYLALLANKIQQDALNHFLKPLCLRIREKQKPESEFSLWGGIFEYAL